LCPEPVARGREQPAVAAEQLQVARDRAHLAHPLLALARRRVVVRPRRGLEDHAEAAPRDVHRDQHVVEDRVLGDRLVQRAAQRVHGTGGPDRGIERALALADELLVAPVEPDAAADRPSPPVTGPVTGIEQQLAADRADLGIGERPHERADRAGLEALAAIGQHKDLAARSRGELVQHRGLAAPLRERVDADRSAADERGAAGGAVRRAVRAHEDLHPLGWVVGLEQVLEPAADARGLVPGHDEHAHARDDASLAHGARSERRERAREQRIAHVHVGQRGHGAPEHDLEEIHFARLARGRKSR
jgi:hypothetical protein